LPEPLIPWKTIRRPTAAHRIRRGRVVVPRS
jgi:hypothetical protein